MKFQLFNGDSLELLTRGERVKCLFADPPDNIGLGYDAYDDNKPDEEYVEWLHDLVALSAGIADICWFSFNAKWTFAMGGIFESLIAKSGGKLSGKPCVQVFTFGQHNPRDLGNNHRPLWRLMWADAKLYPDRIKVPSWRQRNGDKRAAPGGRVPGDVLDMQYDRCSPTGREPAPGSEVWPGDVLDFPRVTVNSKQRCDWHPTQLHEELVERCVKLSTQPGDRTLDPFGGTGTTLRVCRRLDQPCTLFELDKTYCDHIARENKLKRQRSGFWAG